MKFVAALLVSMLLSGCVIVPYQQHNEACRLLTIALDEADMSPAWYTHAGDIVEACGDSRGKYFGLVGMCAATKRNGYDLPEECKGL